MEVDLRSAVWPVGVCGLDRSSSQPLGCSGGSHLSGRDHRGLSLTGGHHTLLLSKRVLPTADRSEHAVPELNQCKHMTVCRACAFYRN